MMILIRLLFVSILSVNSQQIFKCDFDYGQSCILGLARSSYVLLNETSNEPQLPASDVAAIQTSNDIGECFFPFKLNSFDMFFCQKTDPNLPSTCPTFNETGPRINCSEGEYGYEKFEVGDTGYRSYTLDLSLALSYGQHCIRFYYYLSNNYSNGTIHIIIQDNQTNQNETILTVSSRFENRWYQIRHDFHLDNENPTIHFLFERQLSTDSNPFYVAIDDITIIDLQCEPIPDTTSTTSQTFTSTTIQTESSALITTSENIFSTTSAILSSTSQTNTISSTILPSTSQTSTISSTNAIDRTSSTTNFHTENSTLILTERSTTLLINSTIITTSTNFLSSTRENSSSIKTRSNILSTILFLIFFYKNIFN
ncbi:unnamed protein product [Rotaria magnacalcarata]|uniref:MAM domain-containing protein n=1 Tax=Rotaria magnacalcarata TaxID=392030 RepID=A0A815N103_9BILA|nr:unnamed protein product [Rotaria magnacalcarata]CAF1643264.1 unnamed protein product [Rotaria magnacalcarata]CAF2140376.1 unnamed protein product [Rotaria magnacalcarata]CAF2143653.1 unnamed protein product [Rotaria magnacalcarata]CAF2244225.1 unnamed protein product [Rotaria magnacalcarata]